MPFDQSINRFRFRRGQILRRQIETLRGELGRDLHVLDLGGRANYWANVGTEGLEHVTLLNTSEDEFEATPETVPAELFSTVIGDACDLAAYDSKSVDLVHSNSVIEHVGDWNAMRRMARECLRVGRSGWVQTPAWEFPVEPHFHLPLVHWLGTPALARFIAYSPLGEYRECDLDARRSLAESVNLVSGREFEALFPGVEIHRERVLFVKSYVARWLPGPA